MQPSRNPFSMTVLSAGPSQPHAGWCAVDELAGLVAGYFGASLVSPRPAKPPAWRRLSGREKPAYERMDVAGGDVLFVVARGPQDLHMIEAIPQARRRFRRIQAFVIDSYHYAGFPAWAGDLDGIAATAKEDVHFLRAGGVRAGHVYQGTDALRWAPRADHARGIDLVAYGRTPGSFHRELQRRFHDAGSPWLYLHSPIGTLAGPSVQLERGMLFKLLHRTRISLAFHMLVEPEGDRPRSMMVTSRWLESLGAGCIVAGRRPLSTMADDMLAWPQATVELPDDAGAAADRLQGLLASGEDMAQQRRANVANVLRRHDWRHRIVDLCRLMDWPVPAGLAADVEAVQALARSWDDRASPAAATPKLALA